MQVLGMLDRRSGEDSFKRILEATVSAACRSITGANAGKLAASAAC